MIDYPHAGARCLGSLSVLPFAKPLGNLAFLLSTPSFSVTGVFSRVPCFALLDTKSVRIGVLLIEEFTGSSCTAQHSTARLDY